MSVTANQFIRQIKNQPANMSIDEYRSKLLDKIARAGSEKNIRRYIDTAVNAMHEKRVNGHIVNRFITKISDELELGLESDDPEKARNFRMAANLISETMERVADLYRMS